MFLEEVPGHHANIEGLEKTYGHIANPAPRQGGGIASRSSAGIAQSTMRRAGALLSCDICN